MYKECGVQYWGGSIPASKYWVRLEPPPMSMSLRLLIKFMLSKLSKLGQVKAEVEDRELPSEKVLSYYML